MKRQRKYPTEDEEQMNLVLWRDFWSEEVPELALLYFIANGVRTGWKTAKKLKRLGVVNGVPDLHLPVPSRGFGSLYVEMKALDGRVSDDQKYIQAQLIEHNHCVAVSKGAEAAKVDIMWYLQIPKQKAEAMLGVTVAEMQLKLASRWEAPRCNAKHSASG